MLFTATQICNLERRSQTLRKHSAAASPGERAKRSGGPTTASALDLVWGRFRQPPALSAYIYHILGTASNTRALSTIFFPYGSPPQARSRSARSIPLFRQRTFSGSATKTHPFAKPSAHHNGRPFATDLQKFAPFAAKCASRELGCLAWQGFFGCLGAEICSVHFGPEPPRWP